MIQLAGFARFIAAETTWIAPDDWAARADRDRQLQDGERVLLGFHGSYRRDTTALVACAVEDGFVTPLAVWERPAAPPSPRHAPAGEWKVPRDDVDETIAEAMERFEVATTLWRRAQANRGGRTIEPATPGFGDRCSAN